MNRKILFRGFHPDEKGKTVITLNGEKIRGAWLYWNQYGTLQGDYYYERGRFYRYIHDLVVYPETFGQWVTANKNGKDIFEDDKVKSSDCGFDFTAIVKFDRVTFEYIAVDEGGYRYALEDFDWEVVGNKWEVQE